MFDKLAHKYDAGNILHSFGTKWMYDKKAMNNIPFPKNPKILDLCTGSGDIATYLAKTIPGCEITALDASTEMIKLAKIKAKDFSNIKFIEGDALKLPFEDNVFDVVIISYGLRNLNDIKLGIREMVRVTKSGGHITSIDQGKPSNPLFKFGYKIYFYKIAPLIGKLIFHRGEYNTFKYLPESNNYYPAPNKLVELFKTNGMTNVKNHNFFIGAIAQQIGQKI